LFCFVLFFLKKDLVLLCYFVLAKAPGEDGRFWEEMVVLGESLSSPLLPFLVPALHLAITGGSLGRGQGGNAPVQDRSQVGMSTFLGHPRVDGTLQSVCWFKGKIL
jgi:hypothetical protein